MEKIVNEENGWNPINNAEERVIGTHVEMMKLRKAAKSS